MSKDNKPLEIAMSDEKITSLASAVLRITQHVAGMVCDEHQSQEAREFLLSTLLLSAYSLNESMTSVCSCERCTENKSRLAGHIAMRATDLLNAFAEQQDKGAH